MNTLEMLLNYKLVAIIRNIEYKHIDFVLSSLVKAGVKAVEVTMNTPEFEKISYYISHKYKSQILLGAGTVLSPTDVVNAKKCGAQYIISPNVDIDVIKKTKELDLVSIPGAITPTEIMTAVNAGADIVKLFPIDGLGPDYVKAIKAPLDKIKMMAVAIPKEKINCYKNIGIYCYGNGAMILPNDLVKTEDNAIVSIIKEYLSEVES